MIGRGLDCPQVSGVVHFNDINAKQSFDKQEFGELSKWTVWEKRFESGCLVDRRNSTTATSWHGCTVSQTEIWPNLREPPIGLVRSVVVGKRETIQVIWPWSFT
jgi:hypothetical protein